jgi:hypothetical protein
MKHNIQISILGILSIGGSLSLLACFDKTEDSPADVEDTAVVDDTAEDSLVCAALSLDECATEDLCSVIMGTPQESTDEGCFIEGEPTAYGCMDVDQECDTSMVFGTEDENSDSLVIFYSSCIPEDWSTIDILNYEVCEDDPNCSELTADECGTNDSCEGIIGTPQYEDSENACFHEGDPSILGCMDAGTNCDTAMIFGMDPSTSDLALFPTSCIPNGWEEVNIFVYEVCEQDETQSIEVCEPTNTDPFDIISMTINGDLLTLSLTYSGGCQDHEYELCWDGMFTETNPAQNIFQMETEIELGHNSFQDECDAIITQEIEYDLTGLKQSYISQFGSNGTPVTLRMGHHSVDYYL